MQPIWPHLLENLRSFLCVKQVYQDRAIKDKERYRVEMEDYRERLKASQAIISDAVPLQQRFPLEDVVMAELDSKTLKRIGGESSLSLDNDSSSGNGSGSGSGSEDKMEEEPEAETYVERVVGAQSDIVDTSRNV